MHFEAPSVQVEAGALAVQITRLPVVALQVVPAVHFWSTQTLLEHSCQLAVFSPTQRWLPLTQKALSVIHSALPLRLTQRVPNAQLWV